MARKSKGFAELLSQGKEEKVRQRQLEKLQQRIQDGTLGFEAAGVLLEPKGEVKMSKVLGSFVEPYLAFAHNKAQRRKLLEVAILAWNLAIMPESERQLMIDQLIADCSEPNDLLAQQDMREIIDELIARKQKFFANNERFIIDFQLQDTGKQLHFSVASTLSNPLTADQ